MAVRLSDVALQANVSPAVVSRVLNNKPGVWASEETRQRIIDVARELKYRPSAMGRALSTGRTMQIGVSASDSDWVHGRGGRMLQMRGLIDAAAANNYSVLVIPSPGEKADAHQFESWVEGGKCDGYCVFAEQSDSEVYDYFREQATPYMVIGNPDNAAIPQVDHDNYRCLYDAVEWLLQQGHQRVAFVIPSPVGHPMPPHVLVMLKGYQDAQENLFGRFDPSLLLHAPSEDEVILGFLRGAAPTAVIIYGFPRLICWRTLMLKHGIRIPEDITLLAHLDVTDVYDAERARIAQGLAIQPYDPRLAGITAGNNLIQWINGEPPAQGPQLIPSSKPMWWREPMYALDQSL